MAAVLPSFNGIQSSPGTGGWHEKDTHGHTHTPTHTLGKLACRVHARSVYVRELYERNKGAHISITGGLLLRGGI